MGLGAAAGAHTRRTLNFASGVVTYDEADGTDVLDCNETRLIVSYGPRWRLLVIGAGQLTHYVASLALGCDYQVMVCDPRSEYAEVMLAIHVPFYKIAKKLSMHHAEVHPSRANAPRPSGL